jgi:hypothetical protein
MTKFIPPGFDEAKVIDGVHKAMGFGEPNLDADKVTFHFGSRTAGVGTDDQGVPFNPTGSAGDTEPTAVAVTCAIEFRDSGGQAVTFGQIAPTEVVVTLLDPEYQQIKGFSYLTAGGDRYLYDLTEPVIALGSIDVWVIHAKAENER